LGQAKKIKIVLTQKKTVFFVLLSEMLYICSPKFET